MLPGRLRIGHSLTFRALQPEVVPQGYHCGHPYAAACGEDAPFPDPRPWLEASEGVRLAAARLHWQPHERRSASTGHRMPLDGFVGALTYAAPEVRLAPFLPLLYLGAALGVGRGCSFGNGRYRVEPPAALDGQAGVGGEAD